MKKHNKTEEWIIHAESDFAIAKQGRAAKKILYESLCFHCQQVAEKALKAVLIFHKIDFPKTHDIEFLLELCKQNEIVVPKLVKECKSLSEYAVIARYPGNEQKIEIKEFKQALKLSENVLKWAKSLINKTSNLF